MTFWLLGALIALGGAVFHGWIGGRIYMRNISTSDLLPLTQSLSLVSWQMFTIFLLLSGATYLLAAFSPSYQTTAAPMIVGNALGAGLFLLLGALGHGLLLRMPGTYLMGSTAILGWLAYAP